jgi:hypothetical protein
MDRKEVGAERVVDPVDVLDVAARDNKYVTWVRG